MAFNSSPEHKNRVPVKAVLLTGCVITASALLAGIGGACSQPSSPPEAVTTRYDPDLSRWKTASWSPFGAGDVVRGLAYGEVNGRGVYVAVAYNKIAYSYDGDIWLMAKEYAHSEANPFGSNGIAFTAVCYGAGTFIAVGEGARVASSTNGIEWDAAGSTLAPFYTTRALNIYGVAYGGGVFVAVGEEGAIASVESTGDKRDGWQSRRDFDPDSDPGNHGRNRFPVTINGIAFSGGKFYICANGGNLGWADAATLKNSGGGIDWGHYNYASAPKPEDAIINVQKIAAGMRGGKPAIGITYNDGQKIAIIDAEKFCKGDYWDRDLETFNLYEWGQLRPVRGGITFCAPEEGKDGYWLIAGDAAMIGHWWSEFPSDASTRYWTALSFKEFKRWGIKTTAALNGRFFVAGDDGKIGYSGGYAK